MGYIAVKRMQSDGPATVALPGGPAETRAQSLQPSADLKESFGERLNQAVDSATDGALALFSNPKTPGLVSTEPGFKTGDSLEKKSPIHAALVLTSDHEPAIQQASLEAQKGSVIPSEPINKDQIASLITTPPGESCTDETLVVKPHADLVSTPATFGERSKSDTVEKSIPTTVTKDVDSKKLTKSKKTDVAETSIRLNDTDPHLPIQSAVQPANPAAVSAGLSSENQVVQPKKSSLATRVGSNKEITGTLPVMFSSVGVKGAFQDLQIQTSASPENFKGQLHSEITGKIIDSNAGAEAVRVNEVPTARVPPTVVLHDRVSAVVQVPSLPLLSGFESNTSTAGLVHSEPDATQVFAGDGFAGEGLVAFAAHEFSRPAESALNAAMNTLEIGVAHGTHGWLRVRAEMENGLVSASLYSGSAAGREMLHRELPALSDFLHQEKLEVSALVVKEEKLPMSDGLPDTGADMQRQGQSPQQRSQGQSEHRSDNDSWKSVDAGRAQVTRTVLESESLFLSAAAVTKGGWLNVRV